MSRIRAAKPDQHERLVVLWLNSVRASHGFLTEEDIQSLLPLVRGSVIPNLKELWVLCDDSDVPVGFMGLDGNSLEALFVDPRYFRRGGGRVLVGHARQLKGPLVVSVNEQNTSALMFYLALGFQITGRSPLDDGGRPFPLLHLRDAGPGPDGTADDR